MKKTTLNKLVLLALTLAMLLAFAVPTMAESQFNGVSGVITAVNADGVEVKQDNGQLLLFRTDANTLYINRTGGGYMSAGDLKAGMAFYAWHSMEMTASLPAQSYLHTMIVTTDSEKMNGQFFNVGSVTVTSEGVALLNTAGDLYATVPKGMQVQFFAQSGLQNKDASSIAAGAQMMIWYNAVTKSYPGQTTVLKALVFRNGDAVKPSTPTPDVPATGSVSLLGGLLLSAAALGLVVRRARVWR